MDGKFKGAGNTGESFKMSKEDIDPLNRGSLIKLYIKTIYLSIYLSIVR